MNKLLLSFLAVGVLGLTTACGPQAFVKGEYDDVEKENNLNDRWSETDMQKAVTDLVASMNNSAVIATAKKRPVLMITKLQNKTEEHIDTESVMDMVRVEIGRTGRVSFIDKQAREDIASEYDYQNSGMVTDQTKKGPGGQTGADFILNGRLDSIVQQAGSDKSIYYKLTLNLTNLKTTQIEWSDQKQLRKKYKKRSVGL